MRGERGGPGAQDGGGRETPNRRRPAGAALGRAPPRGQPLSPEPYNPDVDPPSEAVKGRANEGRAGRGGPSRKPAPKQPLLAHRVARLRRGRGWRDARPIRARESGRRLPTPTLDPAHRPDARLSANQRRSLRRGEGGEWEEAARGRRRRPRRKREEGRGSPGGAEAPDAEGDDGGVRRNPRTVPRPCGRPEERESDARGGRAFYVGRRSQRRSPSPLPHIRAFGGAQTPPPRAPFMATGGGGRGRRSGARS